MEYDSDPNARERRPGPTLLWLTRYLLRDQTPADRETIARWLAAEPGRAQAFDAVEQSIGDMGERARRATTVSDADVERALAGALHQIAAPHQQAERHVPAQKLLRQGITRPFPVGIRWGVTACLAFIAGGVWMLNRPVSPSEQAQHYTTPVGQRATLTLADGSEVLLAPGTTVSVGKDFGMRTSRAVTVTGEAYFTVAQHEGAPFVVNTIHGSTRVLGTEFLVTRYPEDAATRVAVVSGKVQSAHTDGYGDVTLTANMLAIMGDSGIRSSTVNSMAPYTNWTRGQLDFDNAPLPEVLKTMERWYGVRFRVADSTLLAATLSGSFNFKSTTAALNFLASLLGANMTFETTHDTAVVTLRSQKSRSVAPLRRDGRRVFDLSHEVGR